MNANYRFPGLNAYSKKDASIFKGRYDDSQNLFDRLLLNKTTVFHAESGIGKSSLIQAGLLPLIDRYNEEVSCEIIPIEIKLTEVVNDPENNNRLLVDFVFNKIYEKIPSLKQNPFLLIPDMVRSLWLMNKQCETTGQYLVLIFDQFENIQIFTKKQIDYFKKELFYLLGSKIPAEIYSFIEEGLNIESNLQLSIREEYNFFSVPGRAKCLFVVREDKLGVMTRFSDLFPDILKNDFAIEPLTKKDAFQAINEPAGIEGNYYSKPFYFKDDNILKELIEKIADGDTHLVDPIQLQIVARDIERNIVIGKGKTVIEESDIPEVSDIIRKFYDDCWDTVSHDFGLKENEIFDVKKVVVPQLISNGRRDLIITTKIPEGNPTNAMHTLKKEGLIREVISDGNTFYQLTHDRLVDPVKNDILRIEERDRVAEEVRIANEETEKMNNRLERTLKKLMRFRLAFGLLILAIILCFIYVPQYFNKEKDSAISSIINSLASVDKKNDYYLRFLENKDFKNAIIFYCLTGTYTDKDVRGKYNSKTVQDTLKAGLRADYLFSIGKYDQAMADYEKVISYIRNHKGNTAKIYNIVSSYYASVYAFRDWVIARQDSTDVRASKNIGLENVGINVLPDEIKEFKSLENLQLKGNNFETIPPNILSIQTIREINLQNNKISVIPKEISKLVNLETLYLNQNSITTIPKELCTMRSLRYLTLNNNQILIIPDEIKELKNLDALSLSGNLFSEFPLMTLELESLKKLYLNNCIAIRLPDLNLLKQKFSTSAIERIDFMNNPVKLKGEFYNKDGKKIVINQ
ncbi:leucine-rich repeat domain-containing protein [Chryseobacterium sp. Tr-659]|uniref:leucine-rich repeat domain-containing protein n=1 Tax=Chryseobacterium sp. Tr-659 TaxID=2608340 RepID=UPI001423B42D|nr:leucine-rich repeat domain-containing protein [Chryseobacterium sp. Tr-659]NIF04787.1 leucine-rich repeat domain-containing protein [Chryseobacterium sp. Tr-659]